MRIFVTGSTGYVGSAIVRALVKAGHEVGGLVRSRAKEDAVRAAGAIPIFGNLKDVESYQHFAASSQAVVHAAFESPDVESLAVEDLVGALVAEGEQKAFIYNSGVFVLGDTGGQPADETAPTDHPLPMTTWRPPIEARVLAAASEDLATAVVRPGVLYGAGRGGWLSRFIETARDKGAAEYVGTGGNHWAMIHADDMADLFRRVVEGRARGVFHAVDESHPTTLELARACSEAVGRKGATRSIPFEALRQELGRRADPFVLDQLVVARRSRELGWAPALGRCVKNIPDAVRQWVS